MKFKEFLSEQLNQRRGFQTELADHLEVAKSTITAWRQGATPDFASCLKLADYFELDPIDVFEMLDDSNYVSIYQRFVESSAEAGAEGEAGARRAPSEEDLYPDGVHARLHRDLQYVLENGPREAAAITTMIRLAAGQVRTEAGQRDAPLSQRITSVYRTLRSDSEDRVREKLQEEERPPQPGDLHLQRS